MTADPRCRLGRCRWNVGATVLIWPNGDQPPLLAKIDGAAWDGIQLVAHLRTATGSAWAPGNVISSAKPVLDAIAAGKNIQFGHC